jgi:hypothetical protein
MANTNRVQRWREGKRKEGLKAVTVWLTMEEDLRLKDLALQWHCSPSALMQQALAQFLSPTASNISAATDTSQIRELIRAELAQVQAEAASVTDTVTESVTETLARDLPAMVRQLVERLALEALGLPITATNSNVTDTEPPEEGIPRPSAPRTRGGMRERILTLLKEHPEGLSAEQIRAALQPAKPLGDTLQGMRRQRKVHTRGQGKDLRYFVA